LPRVASPNLPPQAAVSPRAVSPRAASPKGCLAKRLSRQKAVSPKGCLAKRLSRQKAVSPKGCLAKRLPRQKAAEGPPPGQAPGARALPKARVPCRRRGAVPKARMSCRTCCARETRDRAPRQVAGSHARAYREATNGVDAKRTGKRRKRMHRSRHESCAGVILDAHGPHCQISRDPFLRHPAL
jgi:hypothetical protein